MLIIICVGIAFDVLGVAATASQEQPFHAMAADRVPGARQAGWLVRNAHEVASFAQDIVGDISGTLSGAIGAAIVFRIVAARPDISETLLTTLMVAAVAALTVGAKAYFKVVAFRRSTQIMLWTGRVLYHLENSFGIRIANKTKRKRRRKQNKKRGNDGP